MRVRAICIECDRGFWREDHQHWRERCVGCWVELKNERPVRQTDASAYQDLRAEIGSNFKPLLGLVHPDRHCNSEQSNKVTAWLLSLRERLGL